MTEPVVLKLLQTAQLGLMAAVERLIVASAGAEAAVQIGQLLSAGDIAIHVDVAIGRDESITRARLMVNGESMGILIDVRHPTVWPDEAMAAADAEGQSRH
jgi:hypothetical protein